MAPPSNHRVASASRRICIAVLAVLAIQVLLHAVTTGPTAEAAAPAAASCHRPAHGFVPTSAAIPALGRTVRVIQVRRTRDGAVGAGPVTEAGKWLMSMDPQTRPGSHRGSVLLSGHTWPDGSALGNAMLRDLWRGDRVVLRGKNGRRACYRIAERTSYPANQVPSRQAFRSSGPERIVIVACSGRRLGPGNWTRRTVWYGTPVKPPAPRPAPPSNPAPPGNNAPPTLLGGLLGGLIGGL